MPLPKFSITALFLFVTLLAIGFAALEGASDRWSEVMTTLTVAILTTASFVGWYSDGERRAFWCGFAIVGWCYFAAMNMHFTLFENFQYKMLTRFPLDYIKPRIIPDAYIRDANGTITSVRGSTLDNYDQIARCLETICLPLLFGFLASHLARKRFQERSRAKLAGPQLPHA